MFGFFIVIPCGAQVGIHMQLHLCELECVSPFFAPSFCAAGFPCSCLFKQLSAMCFLSLGSGTFLRSESYKYKTSSKNSRHPATLKSIVRTERLIWQLDSFFNLLSLLHDTVQEATSVRRGSFKVHKFRQVTLYMHDLSTVVTLQVWNMSWLF